MQKLALFFPLAASLLALSCGSDTSAGGRPRIAVIPKGTTHEFWKSIHAGAVKSGRELDVEILWKGPQREDDRDDQIKVVEDAITRGVDGIVIAPLDNKALVPPLRDAVRQGIPVIVVDSGVEWDGMVSFIATDNYRGGYDAGRKLGALLNGEGRVIMMRYLEGSASTMKREAGFLEAIGEFEGIEVVSDNQYGGASSESAYATAENLLITYDDVDGIFCPNESTVFGMLRALQDAGRAGRVRFVGFDSSEKLAEALRNGEIDGLVLQRPFKMGELGVENMIRHLRGEKVERLVDTGASIATPGNVDDEEIQALLVPDLSEWLD